MHEINENTTYRENATYRLAQPAQLPDDEFERFLFIDLTDSEGWADLESALPEGAVDDLTGDVVEVRGQQGLKVSRHPA